MMATTHAFIGAALASATVVFAPEAAPVAIAAAFVGGIVPDFDLAVVHRKDLHFPVLAWLPAGAAFALAAVLPTTGTVALAAFFGSVAVHGVTDIVGGSVEPEPWKMTNDRAVYNHVRGEWHSARRWVRYDGAPEDLGVAAFAAAIPLTVTSGLLHDLLLVALIASIAYTLVRKRLLDGLDLLRETLPPAVVTWLPEREQ